MSGSMTVMELSDAGQPLRLASRPLPKPVGYDLLAKVRACGVCRTDVHVADGDLKGPMPIVPGHEVVARVLALGDRVEGISLGDRIGIPWLGGTCGTCTYCRSGRENICDRPVFTGFTRDGGFATHCLADARFCLRLPEDHEDVAFAPLLCAGLIGYRSLKAAGDGSPVGLYGFGAAAHIIVQVAVWQGRTVFAFTRPDDDAGRNFALSLGCAWAGSSDEAPPEQLDAAIIFAPVGALVPEALRHVRKGGHVVCAGIHMSEIPSFPYADLWGERTISSVANLTRADGAEFLELAARIPVKAHTTPYSLKDANAALAAVRNGQLDGAAVLVP